MEFLIVLPLCKITSNVYNWIDSEHDYQQKLNKEEYHLLNFLKEGLSLWRSSEFMGQIVGKRKDVFRRTCIFTDGHHDNVPPTIEFQQDTSVNVVEEEINSVATQWGLEVVRITGDGNCFFTSVAFQVSQMLSRPDLHASIRDHFNTIGISPEVSITEISKILRKHLVSEWTGPFTEEYQEFVDNNIDFFEQAQEFLTSGTFAADIGDMMPLGLSNVLQIPILVLSTQHLVPFTEIYPRSYVGNGEAILLNYNHIGPGHYDALIHTEIERMEEVHEANVQQEAAIAIDQQSMTTNSRRSCRCGINTKSNNAAKQKTSDYKSWCKCISQLGSCGPKCKCKGHCGQSGNCRIVDEELKRHESQTKENNKP